MKFYTLTILDEYASECVFLFPWVDKSDVYGRHEIDWCNVWGLKLKNIGCFAIFCRTLDIGKVEKTPPTFSQRTGKCWGVLKHDFRKKNAPVALIRTLKSAILTENVYSEKKHPALSFFFCQYQTIKHQGHDRRIRHLLPNKP